MRNGCNIFNRLNIQTIRIQSSDCCFTSAANAFYEDINFGGRFFCANIGADRPMVPNGTNDKISSIRLFGRTELTVYRDRNFRGSSRRFVSSMSDLRRAGWNDRISSFRVDDFSNNGSNWGGGYGGGGWGGGGGNGYHEGRGSGWGGAYGTGSGSGWGNNSNGGRYTYREAEDIVRRAYRSTLGRDPDPAARSWVREVMKSNLSQRQLEAELRKSDEYRNKPR